jgi:hypothetical protein
MFFHKLAAGVRTAASAAGTFPHAAFFPALFSARGAFAMGHLASSLLASGGSLQSQIYPPHHNTDHAREYLLTWLDRFAALPDEDSGRPALR